MPFPRCDVEVVGNLGRDPESRFTPTGQPVTSFSVAVTRKWTDNDQPKEETTWYRVTTWGKLAEACRNLEKGQQVLIKGYLKPDPKTGGPVIYNRQDGSPGASFDLTAQEVWPSLFGRSVPTTAAEPADETEEIPF
jgi:single-strand DNA-binding protein